jgi:hypothetical protein
MPEADLSSAIPATAVWVKLRYALAPKRPGADLIARVWSGALDDAVVLRGPSGEAVVKMNVPQKVSYQAPVTVALSLKVVGYSETDQAPSSTSGG